MLYCEENAGFSVVPLISWMATAQEAGYPPQGFVARVQCSRVQVGQPGIPPAIGKGAMVSRHQCSKSMWWPAWLQQD